MDDQWFLTRNGETIAQYSTEQFRRAVAKGLVRPGDYMRRSDSSALILADDFLPRPFRKSRSGALSFIAAGAVFIAVLAGFGFAVTALAPQLVQTALISMSKRSETAGFEARREALKKALLEDQSNSFLFKALAEKDPQAFEDMITHFVDMAGEGTEDLIAKSREYLMKTILEPRSRNLSDDDKIAMLTLSRDFGAQLAGTNAKMCIAHALGKPYGDIRPFITEDLVKREQEMMLKMLEATPQEFDLPSAKDVQALNGKVAVALYQAHGDDVSLLDLENVPEGKEEKACRMFGAYLDGVLNLPQEERVALVRTIVLDPDRLGADTTAQEPAAAEPPPDAAASAPPTASADSDSSNADSAQAEQPVIIPPAPTEAESPTPEFPMSQ